MIRTVSHGPRVSRQPAPIRLWLWALVSMVLLWLNMTSARANESVNFSLPGLDGKTYALAAFRGQWVVVNFWATWCGTCVDEMAALESFAVANKDAQVLAVNFEDIEPDQLRAFVHALKRTFPILLIGEKPLLPFEPLKGLPTTAIVNPAGALVAHHTGAITRDALERFIAEEHAKP